MKQFTKWFMTVLMAAVALSCSSVDLQEEIESANGEQEQILTRSTTSYGLHKISGNVTDENDESVIGATISVIGNTQRTTTDFDGNFTLYAEPSDILQVSYIGYRSLLIPVMRQTVFKIKLSSDLELGVSGPIDESQLPIVDFSGTVKNIDGQPLSNVEVHTSIRGSSHIVYTDQDGKYSTRGSLISYVSYRKDGYDCQVWQIADYQPLEIYLVPSDLPIDISGTVTNFYGLPTGGVKVQIENETTCVYTSSDGKYSITAPKNGSLIFSKTGYIDTVNSIFEKNVLDVVINNETVMVTGDVKFENKPLEDVLVTVQGTNVYTRTSVSGYYSIQAPYNATLEFSKPGYNSRTEHCSKPIMDINMIKTPATTRQITGTITDEYGEPMVGVTVLRTGTNYGSVSDFDGRYALTIPTQGRVILHFEYIGYVSQDIEVGNRSVLNVTMQEDPDIQ